MAYVTEKTIGIMNNSTKEYLNIATNLENSDLSIYYCSGSDGDKGVQICISHGSAIMLKNVLHELFGGE